MKTVSIIVITLMLLKNGLSIAQPGSLDSSFNQDGKVKSSLLNNGSSIAVQADGKILVANGFSVIRFKQNGTIDKSFGNNGIASTSFEGFNAGSLFALQPDGKIILAGFSIDNSDVYYVSLARFNTNGVLDSSFGINGQVKTDLDYYTPNGITVTPDGKLLVAVADYFHAFSGIIILAYNTDGSIYSQFSYDIGSGHRDYANALTIQSTGKIVVTGSIDTTGFNAFVLLRFKSNGLLDSSFKISGNTVLNYAQGYALALQPNDRIITLADNPGGNSVLARFTKNGFLDSSFGTDGKVYPPFHPNSLATTQSDGKIIITGTLYNGSNYDFAVARYRANGKPDNTFGSNGIVITDFGSKDNADAAAIQTDGKIVVAGSSYRSCAVARYKGDAVLFNNMGDIKAQSPDITSHIKIYPNPVQSVLNIGFNDAAIKKRISIYDVYGKLLITRTAEGNAQIDLKQLVSGSYRVRINNEHGGLLYESQVIKQ